APPGATPPRSVPPTLPAAKRCPRRNDTCWALHVTLPCEGSWHVSGPVAVPAPSWPYVLRPQQYAPPLAVTPQVCEPPALTVVKLSLLATRTGIARLVVVPSPS